MPENRGLLLLGAGVGLGLLFLLTRPSEAVPRDRGIAALSNIEISEAAPVATQGGS